MTADLKQRDVLMQFLDENSENTLVLMCDVEEDVLKQMEIRANEKEIM